MKALSWWAPRIIPHLELILFVVVLTFYLLTLLGNMTIILLSVVDSQLHTPMYFFLANLSFLDVCFTTGSIPQMLYNLRGADKTISYLGCAIQLYFVLALGGVICQLLELEGNAAESFLETQLFTNVKSNTLFLVI